MKKIILAILLLPTLVSAQQIARKDVTGEFGAKIGNDTKGFFSAQFETGAYQKRVSAFAGLSTTSNKSNMFRFFYAGTGCYILKDDPEQTKFNIMPYLSAGYMYTTKKVPGEKDIHGQDLLLTYSGIGFRPGVRFVLYGDPEKQGYGGRPDMYLTGAYNCSFNKQSENSFLVGIGLYIRNN